MDIVDGVWIVRGDIFAAMEKPVELWKDIMDFVEVAWVMRTSAKL